ncbi:hypothetical protein O6H91_19G050800 [Diphasiastrum complanatum]|uniref:Uncharacterized protein n=1 Tax=Diphasiastrum complanatum TaxID=34168 RepID=A0ACC2AVX6_DIPCM|nr:hypothetical protein O6H91_19G050800 [Diphasiastrum complanatum]
MQTSFVYQLAMKPEVFPILPEQSTSSSLDVELPLRKHKSTEKVLPSPLPLGKAPSSGAPKMTCLCAPTTHPGSFRCRLHRAAAKASMLPIASDSQQSCTSDAKARVSHLPAGGNKSVGKMFSKLSAIEERSKGESSLPKPLLKSKNLRIPSRLSKVTFARDIKENVTMPSKPEIPSPVMQPKLSKHASSMQSVSSVRLMALKKCQSLMKEDVLRMRSLAHQGPQPILSR